jgi:hypothetical protein
MPHIENLADDLASGVTLIQLLVSKRNTTQSDNSFLTPKEIIGDATIGRYNKKPQMRIQFVENVNLALEFIKQRGVGLTNIGAEGKGNNSWIGKRMYCNENSSRSVG